MNLFQPQFSPDLDLPETPVRRTILIASTPRCGSHMIGHAMAGTGQLGVPYEYLNPANLAEWERRLGTLGAEATLTEIIRRRTTPNGTFAIKAHYSQCATIGGHQRLFEVLPDLHVVHLSRADLLRQAISFAIARQTGVWISGQEATSDAAEFDGAMIRDCLSDIALQNARWRSAFDAAGIRPLNLHYEDAAPEIARTVAAIARHAGIALPEESSRVEAPTTRQSRKSRTEDWIERYAAWSAPTPVRRKFLRAIAGARA